MVYTSDLTLQIKKTISHVSSISGLYFDCWEFKDVYDVLLAQTNILFKTLCKCTQS